MTDSNPLDYSDVLCVMPGCDESLYLTWTGSRAIAAFDLTDPVAIDHSDAHTSTWKIECADGHVVLIPAELDFSDDGMAHNSCVAGDHDHDDELRAFTASDSRRLADLVAKMRGI